MPPSLSLWREKSLTQATLALRPPESLDQLVFHRVAGRGNARVDAQLVVDGGQMGVDRARADDQALCHLRVGEPLGHQAQYLDLAGGQPGG